MPHLLLLAQVTRSLTLMAVLTVHAQIAVQAQPVEAARSIENAGGLERPIPGDGIALRNTPDGIELIMTNASLESLAAYLQSHSSIGVRLMTEELAALSMDIRLVRPSLSELVTALLSDFSTLEVREAGMLRYVYVIGEGRADSQPQISATPPASLDIPAPLLAANEDDGSLPFNATVPTIQAESVGRAKAPGELFATLERRGFVEFFVQFSDPRVRDLLRRVEDETASKLIVADAAHDIVKRRAIATMPGPGPQLIKDYRYFGAALLRARSEEQVLNLLRISTVHRAHLDSWHEASLAETLPLINQPTTYGVGYGGAKTVVAVLDTGVDYLHPHFGQCNHPDPALPEVVQGGSACSVRLVTEIAPPDGQLDATGHGTNVSAIVLGVAPETEVIVADVFDGRHASSRDIWEGFVWVADRAASINVVAVNLSLGTERLFSSICDSPFGSAIEQFRGLGIAVIVATGNDGATGAIASPACHPDAISVASVNDSLDGHTVSVSALSNRSSMLDLWAPGALVSAGGFTMAGTSMAAPHVAGAFAVARAPGALQSDTVDTVLTRMKSTGLPVGDPASNVAATMVDLAALLEISGNVTSLQASDGGSIEHVEVNWSGSRPPYRVYRAPVSDPTARIELTLVPIATNRLFDDSAVPGIRYEYFVQSNAGTSAGPEASDVGFRGLGPMASIASSGFHFVVRRQDGQLLSWGLNDSGQLGDGTQTDRGAPTPVSATAQLDYSVFPISHVGVGLRNTYALRADGYLFAWGDNSDGGVLDGNLSGQQVVPKLLISGIDSFSNGDDILTWINAAGTVVQRRIVAPAFEGETMEAFLVADDGVAETATSIDGVTFLRMNDNRLKSFKIERNRTASSGGSPIYGRPTVFGNSATIETPNYVGCDSGGGFEHLQNVVQVGAGSGAAAALQTITGGGSRVLTWGRNTFGVLGSDNVPLEEESVCPQPVLGSDPLEQVLADIVQIAAGELHFLALRSDGRVVAWGDDRWGQLGDGGDQVSPPPGLDPLDYPGSLARSPVIVTDAASGDDLQNIIHIGASADSSYAVDSEGVVYTWGKVPAGPICSAGIPDFTDLDAPCHTAAVAFEFEGARMPVVSIGLPSTDLEISGEAANVGEISGRTAEFSMSVVNSGNEAASAVEVSIEGPADLSGPTGKVPTTIGVSSSRGACSETDGWSCELDELLAGESAEIVLVATALSDGPHTLRAEVRASEADSARSNNVTNLLLEGIEAPESNDDDPSVIAEDDSGGGDSSGGGDGSGGGDSSSGGDGSGGGDSSSGGDSSGGGGGGGSVGWMLNLVLVALAVTLVRVRRRYRR